MKNTGYFLGIDSGTQSTKTILLDAASGEVVASASQAYELIEGLPPGPICNPGKAAIAAALAPAASDDLYFVADGSGGHVFAATLDQHNRNVAAWRKLHEPTRH